jgi:hypothetical protein
MPNFANCCIYKIISKDDNTHALYVGYTNNYEKMSKCYREKFKHKRICKFIIENGGWDNFEIIKIEDFPCSSERDASKRKRYWIKELELIYYLNFGKPDRRETCICGSDISIYGKSKHLKTKIHKNYLRRMELLGE